MPHIKSFKAAGFVLAGLAVLSGCGSTNAATPAPTPSSGETAPPVPTLPPVEQEQLLDQLEPTLDSLQPPQAGIRGAMSLGDPIGSFITPQDCNTTAKWLGLPLPYLPSAESGEAVQVCGVANSAGDVPLPDREGRAADGGPLSGVIFSITAPKDTDVLQSSWEQLQEKGVTVARVEWGTRDTAITKLDPTDSTDPAGGYMMARLRSNATALTIQNLGTSTRVAYTKTTPQGEIFLVSFDIPGSDVPANVSEFLAGQNIG